MLSEVSYIIDELQLVVCNAQTLRQRLQTVKTCRVTTTLIGFDCNSRWRRTTDRITLFQSQRQVLVTSWRTWTTVVSRCRSSTTCCRRCCVESPPLPGQWTAATDRWLMVAATWLVAETCLPAPTAQSGTAAPATWHDIASLINDRRRWLWQRRQQTDASPGSVLTVPRYLVFWFSMRPVLLTYRRCPPISPNPISPNPISPNGLGLEG